MKIKHGYPVINPQTLTFLNPGQEGISFIFAQRLAAFARDKGRKLRLSSGYRDVEYQKKLYEQNIKQYPQKVTVR